MWRPTQAQGDRAFGPEGDEAEPHATRPVELRVDGTDLAGHAEAVGHDPRARLRRHPHHIRVVAVEDRGPVGPERAHHPRLLVARHVERPQAPMVLAPDRGDDGDVRPHDPGVATHLSHVRDADLDDGVPLTAANPQHRVAHRPPRVVQSRTVARPERRGDGAHRRRLAERADDRHDTGAARHGAPIQRGRRARSAARAGSGRLREAARVPPA